MITDPDRSRQGVIANYMQHLPHDSAMYGQEVIFNNWEADPGKFIAAAYPRGLVIAYHEMGQTPYYAGDDKRFIDTLGLTTRRIGFYIFGQSFTDQPMARRFWAWRCSVLDALGRDTCPSLGLQESLDYILDQHPDVVLVRPVLAAMTGPHMPPRALLDNETFKLRYRRRYVVDGLVDVFERRDRQFSAYEGTIPGVNIQMVDQ